MLDVNHWKNFDHIAGANFQLTNRDGKELEIKEATIGDLIRIDLPGLSPIAGKGFDWVIIEKIEENTEGADEDFFAMRVRPIASSLNRNEKSAHFFTEEATSTFILKRTGTKLTASEVGRNEIANTQTNNMADNIRNKVIAFTAAKGFAYPQWKALMKGILKMP